MVCFVNEGAVVVNRLLYGREFCVHSIKMSVGNVKMRDEEGDHSALLGHQVT